MIQSHQFTIASVAILAAGLSSASAALLSYDGFATADYTAGSVDAQPYAGSGYAAGGAWNSASTFEAGGLTYPGLATTDGYSVMRSDGDMIGRLDVSGGGAFESAGVASGGLIGGGGSGTIYYSFLAVGNDGGGGFAGLNVYNGDAERLGIGNANGPAEYSIFGGVPDTVIGTPGTVVDAATHLFVAKIEFGATDAVTVWLDPDPTLSEAAQSPSITATGDHADTAFDNLRMRGDAVWSFDEIRFGTSFDDVTPVIPEPSVPILALVCTICLLRRRR